MVRENKMDEFSKTYNLSDKQKRQLFSFLKRQKLTGFSSSDSRKQSYKNQYNKDPLTIGDITFKIKDVNLKDRVKVKSGNKMVKPSTTERNKMIDRILVKEIEEALLLGSPKDINYERNPNAPVPQYIASKRKMTKAQRDSAEAQRERDEARERAQRAERQRDNAILRRPDVVKEPINVPGIDNRPPGWAEEDKEGDPDLLNNLDNDVNADMGQLYDKIIQEHETQTRSKSVSEINDDIKTSINDELKSEIKELNDELVSRLGPNYKNAIKYEDQQIEFHPPLGYEFLGPGTKVLSKLKEGVEPRNKLDQIAQIHDIEYVLAGQLPDEKDRAEAVRLADDKFNERVSELLKSDNVSLEEQILGNVAIKLFGIKEAAEDMGLISGDKFLVQPKEMTPEAIQAMRRRLPNWGGGEAMPPDDVDDGSAQASGASEVNRTEIVIPDEPEEKETAQTPVTAPNPPQQRPNRQKRYNSEGIISGDGPKVNNQAPVSAGLSLASIDIEQQGGSVQSHNRMSAEAPEPGLDYFGSDRDKIIRLEFEKYIDSLNEISERIEHPIAQGYGAEDKVVGFENLSIAELAKLNADRNNLDGWASRKRNTEMPSHIEVFSQEWNRAIPGL